MRTSLRLISAVGLASFVLAAPALAQGTGASAPPSRDRGSQPQRDATPDRARDAARDAASTATAKVGQKAPNFTLADTTGKSHSLTDFKGKIVVLQWINPECPYCVAVMKNDFVKNSVKESREMDKDVVWLFVNSTSHMPPTGSAEYLKEHKLEVPALIDQPGVVGRLYGARTTPHMFVIDTEGVLRYEGAIHDDPRGAKAKANETVTNYVVNTIRQIKAGETVSPANTQPWGCSVKYPAGTPAGTPSGNKTGG